MALKVEIKDNKLFIEIDLEKPTPSSSGKTLVVASTHGNIVTTAKVDDKPITLGLMPILSVEQPQSCSMPCGTLRSR